MIKNYLRYLLLPVLFLAMGLTGAMGAEPAIIAKARAYLGTEASLNAVKNIHYYGKLSIEGMDTMQSLPMEIIFEKPYRQHTSIELPQGTETTVLNDYDAWQRTTAKEDDSRWRLSLLKAPQIQNLRANVWENVSFFRGLENVGGELQDQGQASVDGLVCRKLIFKHNSETVFTRYFDEKTGRLVLTETQRGEKITESGMIEASGVKFPSVLTTVSTAADGSTQTISIHFDRVVVNGDLDEGIFEMPVLRPN